MSRDVVTRTVGVCQGQFTIVGTAITVETVMRRWMAGESIAVLAKDYGLKASAVEAVLRWAANRGEPFWQKAAF